MSVIARLQHTAPLSFHVVCLGSGRCCGFARRHCAVRACIRLVPWPCQVSPNSVAPAHHPAVAEAGHVIKVRGPGDLCPQSAGTAGGGSAGGDFAAARRACGGKYSEELRNGRRHLGSLRTVRGRCVVESHSAAEPEGPLPQPPSAGQCLPGGAQQPRVMRCETGSADLCPCGGEFLDAVGARRSDAHVKSCKYYRTDHKPPHPVHSRSQQHTTIPRVTGISRAVSFVIVFDAFEEWVVHEATPGGRGDAQGKFHRGRNSCEAENFSNQGDKIVCKRGCNFFFETPKSQCDSLKHVPSLLTKVVLCDASICQ
jgi:hypothetical protein